MGAPLSFIDANFFNIDTLTTHQAIASFCLLDRVPCMEQIRENFGKLISVFPRLKQRVSRLGMLEWQEAKDFELNKHIQFIHRPQLDNIEQLLDEASQAFSQGLDLDRPLWKFVVISNMNEQMAKEDQNNSLSCLLFIVHHAFADGIGGMQVLTSLCSSSRDTAPNSPRAPISVGSANPVKNTFSKALSQGRSAFRLLSEALNKSPKSPLNGTNSSAREISILDLPLETLHRIRREFGGTLNEVMLTLISGAVRKYHSVLDHPVNDLRVIMPVSLRELARKTSLGNHLSGVGVRLPISLAEPLERLRGIKEYIDGIKSDGSFGAYAFLAQLNSFLPKSCQRLLSEIAASKTNFICTSMPVSKNRQYIAGAEILGNYGIAALMKGQGVAFAFLKYAEKMCVSLVTDPSIVPQPSRLAQYLRESAEELVSI